MSSMTQPLPLFPLRTVLFPGGLLALKIFEARYLDMIAKCLRTQQPFGVVGLMEGTEARVSLDAVRFANVGTLARIDQVDSPQQGLMLLQCAGTQRFAIKGPPVQAADGLWTAQVELLALDSKVVPTAELQPWATAWAQTATALKEQGALLVEGPWPLDDSGWVAYRWGELLPLEVSVKQQLLELENPLERLSRVADLLQEAAARSVDESALGDPGSATHLH
jgi:uncharacterized protein